MRKIEASITVIRHLGMDNVCGLPESWRTPLDNVVILADGKFTWTSKLCHTEVKQRPYMFLEFNILCICTVMLEVISNPVGEWEPIMNIR